MCSFLNQVFCFSQFLHVLVKEHINIEPGWLLHLEPEFRKPYFSEIKSFLVAEKAGGNIIYPPGSLIFNAFNKTPFEKVKVVILGQDPYHGPGQAMGLSFSVPKGVEIPGSLRNIYKELKQDTGFEIPNHGDLTAWAEQGVFLLNAMLSVRHKSPGSHAKIGWQIFTDEVIRQLSEKRKNLVFMLWGNFARSKKILVNDSKHLILESAHPSPLTGNQFFNNHHFSRANNYLEKCGIEPVNWQLY